MTKFLKNNWRWLLIPIFLLWTYLTVFLKHNEFDFFNITVILAYCSFLAFGLLLGIFFAVLPLRVRILALSLELSFLIYTLNLTSPHFNKVIGVIVFVLSLILLNIIKKNIDRVALFFLILVFLQSFFIKHKTFITTITDQKPNLDLTNITTNQRPAIIHIILDAHIGLEGIDTKTPEGINFSKEFRNFYLSKDFKIYSRAYSEYSRTKDSFSWFLDSSKQERHKLIINDSDENSVSIENISMFADLYKNNYQLNIFQTAYLNLCKPSQLYEISNCKSYLTQSLLNQFSKNVILQGLTSIWINIFKTTELKNILDKLVKFDSLEALKNYDQFLTNNLSPYAALRASYTAELDLEKTSPQSYRLIHLLIPHEPYLLDSSCYYNNIGPQLKIYDTYTNKKYYYQQTLCTFKIIERLLSALDRSPARDNNIVIIQGDHGHKIYSSKIRESLEDVKKNTFSKVEFIKTYSTLFAVRSKGSKGEINRDPISIKKLIYSSIPIFNQTLDNSSSKKVSILQDINIKGSPFQELPLTPFEYGKPSTHW